MICPFCKKRKGEIPIQDEKLNRELWICEECDLDLYDAGTLRDKMEKEIDVQISHHKKEGNIYAVRSLQYLREVLLFIPSIEENTTLKGGEQNDG